MAEDASGKRSVANYVVDHGANANIQVSDTVMTATASIPGSSGGTDSKYEAGGPQITNINATNFYYTKTETRIVAGKYADRGATMSISGSHNMDVTGDSFGEGTSFEQERSTDDLGGGAKRKIKKPKKRNAEHIKEDSVQLSDKITMLYKKHLPPGDTRSMVCEGFKSSSIAGKQPIAIKSILYDEENLREAKILAKLAFHSNVVSIIHVDVYYMGVEKRIYIAMELCSSKSLYDFVTENKQSGVPFDQKQSIELAKQLVEGMKHIHGKNIIHRDMKPHNVLFSIDMKTVKIADFGLSKEITIGSITAQTSPRIGTTGYRSPETYNSDVISQKSDIFSLGLTIFFIWSNGLHPFGDDPEEWDNNIKKHLKRRINRVVVHEGRVAVDLLAWMMRFQPGDRPTAKQILTHKMFGGMEMAVGEDDFSLENSNRILDEERKVFAGMYESQRVLMNEHTNATFETHVCSAFAWPL